MIKVVLLSAVYLCCWVVTVVTAIVALATRRARCTTCSR
jgi:hypothetical protein